MLAFSSKRARLLVAGAFVLGVVAFARAVTFGFVYDDHWTIESGQLDVPFARLVSALRAGRIADATRPAMVVTVWIERALFGAHPGPYHADSIVLYGVVCALAISAALAVVPRARVALAGGILFALAPLHTEVVCAINYREDLLAALGVLVPLAFLTRQRPRARGDWVAAACFALGLFSKESAVALVPLLAAVVAILPKVRARVFAQRRLVALLLGVLVVWAVWRAGLAVRGDDVPRAHYASVAARLLASARFFVRVGVDALLPVRAAPEHARLGAASPLWLVPFAAWWIAIALLARRRVTRTPALGLAIVLLAPLPASPLFAPANEVADRYAFLSVLGSALVWGWLATRLPARATWPIAVVAAAALWIACQASAAPWKTDRALWTEATRVAPTSPRAWVGLSRAARLDGELDEADRDIDRALALDPRFVAAHVTRAYNFLSRGDVVGARAELAVIHDLGADRHRGVAKIAACAALSPDEARACIRDD